MPSYALGAPQNVVADSVEAAATTAVALVATVETASAAAEVVVAARALELELKGDLCPGLCK